MPTYRITFTQLVEETCEVDVFAETELEATQKFYCGLIYKDGYDVINQDPGEGILISLEKIEVGDKNDRTKKKDGKYPDNP